MATEEKELTGLYQLLTQGPAIVSLESGQRALIHIDSGAPVGEVAPQRLVRGSKRERRYCLGTGNIYAKKNNASDGQTVVAYTPIAVGPFNPSHVSGLALWLDPEDISTVTLREDGATDYVTRIDDKSGNGNHFTQPVSGLQLFFTHGGFGGNNALNCAISRHLTAEGRYIFGNTSGVSIFIACKSAAVGGTSRMLFDFGSKPGAGYGVGYSDQRIHGYSAISDGGIFILDGVDQGYGTGAALISSVIEFGALHTLYRNGVSRHAALITGLSKLDATNISEASTRQPDSGPMTIALQSKTTDEATAGFIGFIGEIAIYNKYVGTDERLELEQYFMDKWV